MEAAVRAGFTFILFCVPLEEDVQAVMAYVTSLKREPAPTLGDNGALSESAKRGEAIFNDPKTKCAVCHKMPYGSDLEFHDVGTGPDTTTGRSDFKTTTLVEQWRMSPYLHDGRATTLKEVLTTFNKGDKHGATSHLSPQQIDDLVAYLLTL
jgi:cytochrome c peroxidase